MFEYNSALNSEKFHIRRLNLNTKRKLGDFGIFELSIENR